MTANFRMYAACLAAYNNGVLHGEWIELDGKTADDIQNEIDAMLAASPQPGAEEWAAFDWDGPGLDRFGEFPLLSDVADFVGAMEALDVAGQTAFEAFVNGTGEEDVERFRDAYLGEYDSIEHYAQEFVDDTGMLSDVPDSIARYFDFEAFARDMTLGGDIWTADAPSGGVFVFNNV